MLKTIFITCVPEDENRIKNINKWVRKNLLEDVIIAYRMEDDRYTGKDSVKKFIRGKVNRSSLVIVLLGTREYRDTWIEGVVEISADLRKPVVCIRLPQTDSAKPEVLNECKDIAFNPNAIMKHIE